MEGAGLTNALAMPRGAAVVNLHPAAVGARFSTLASPCGQVGHGLQLQSIWRTLLQL